MNRFCQAMLLSTVLVSGVAQAQTRTSDTTFGVFFVGSTAPSLVFDILLAKKILSDEYVGKGLCLSAIIVGAIAGTASAVAAAVAVSDLSARPIWTSLNVGSAALGVTTAVIGTYALFKFREPPPVEPPEVTWVPQIGFAPSGGVMVGLAGAF